MKTFKISGLGCKVNQYESQLMREQLKAAGFIEANGNPADFYVINTCTVTASADSDSRNLLRRALRQNQDAKIVVTGCYVEKDADEIRKICKDAIIIKNDQKENIANFLLRVTDYPASAGSRYRDELRITNHISDFANHNRAFVKIQDGCDNFCSYCKVPLVRGRPRNREMKDIVREVECLTETGFKEVVLCGICLGAYGDLMRLLQRLECIDGLRRLRLSSIEPVYITKELIDKIASSQKLCRHLHIPLQSGSDRILKLMNRNYTRGQYLKLIDDIRVKMPQIAIATDVMVGFPTETDEEFKNTLRTLEIAKPMRTHVFGFNKRKGTKAFCMPGQVQKDRIIVRSRMVRQLAKELSFSYKRRFQYHIVEVLVENDRDKKTNLLTGYTDTYIKVLFQGQRDMINKLVWVKITEVCPDFVIGQVQGYAN